MNYPAAAPFLIDPRELPKGSVVSYLSCGVPREFAPAERENIKRSLDQAQFVYLRDGESEQRLRRCGIHRDIYVAPDLIVIISDQFQHAAEGQKGREILKKFRVNCERPVLCFQSKPYPTFREEEIVEQLRQYQQRTTSEVILLPLGYCHGDHEFLTRVMKGSNGSFKYVPVYSIFDALSVIAASNVFVGTSLHGNITAFSFGIPHLYGPLPVDKTEGFISTAYLPRELKLGSWREMNDKIDMALEFGKAELSKLAREAKLRVHLAVDELCKQLLN